MDFVRIGTILFVVTLGIVSGIWGGAHCKPEFVSFVAIVITIFAGFLMGIITMLGEPTLLVPGTWRDAQFDLERIKKTIICYKYLFYLYIFILALAGLLYFEDAFYPAITLNIKRGFVACTIIGFCWSVWLPSSLIKLQLSRLEEEINKRRRDVNIPD